MSFAVKQEKFEGPLDLLLDLIEREKLSINDISLATVTDEFMRMVKALPEIDKEELAEFLVIAAQLILIKSRTLLPELAVTEEEEYTLEELEKRLEAYKKVKELAKELKRMFLAKKHMFSREWMSGMESVFYPPPAITPDVLARIFESAINAIPKIEKLHEEKIKRIVSLEDRIRELQHTLDQKVERFFSDIVAHSKDKAEIIVSFLAILELAKQKFLELEQGELFGEIKMRKDTSPDAVEAQAHAGDPLFRKDAPNETMQQ